MWHAVSETGGWGSRVTANGEDHFFEMMNLREIWSDDQLRAMHNDIEKFSAVVNGYLIVISGNPPGQTGQNFDSHAAHLIGLAKERKGYRFPSLVQSGEQIEFWIAGWPSPRKMR
jgi:hypothetical protein